MAHLVIVLSAQWQLRLDLKASRLWLLVCSFLLKMESSRQRRRLQHFQLRLIAVDCGRASSDGCKHGGDDY